MSTQDDLYATEEKFEGKQVTIAFRVPEELRESFNKLCESRNVEASKVLRRFIEREVKAAATSA